VEKEGVLFCTDMGAGINSKVRKDERWFLVNSCQEHEGRVRELTLDEFVDEFLAHS
jgi:hypothetical protein